MLNNEIKIMMEEIELAYIFGPVQNMLGKNLMTCNIKRSTLEKIYQYLMEQRKKEAQDVK